MDEKGEFMNVQRMWVETVEHRSTLKDRIKSFFWCIKHPILTARLAHFAVKILAKNNIDIEGVIIS